MLCQGSRAEVGGGAAAICCLRVYQEQLSTATGTQLEGGRGTPTGPSLQRRQDHPTCARLNLQTVDCVDLSEGSSRSLVLWHQRQHVH